MKKLLSTLWDIIGKKRVNIADLEIRQKANNMLDYIFFFLV